MRRASPVASAALAAFALSALIVAGCTPDGGPELLPTPADQVPEASYGALGEVLTPAGTHAVGPVLEAPLGATRVSALLWLTEGSAAAPAIEARGFDADGAPGPWTRARTTWRQGEGLVVVADLGEVVRAAQLRFPADAADAIERLTWSAVVPVPRVAAAEPSAPTSVGASRQALRADLAALGVRPREDWGARAVSGCSADPTKYRMAIHHTVSSPTADPATAIAGFQAFHIDGRGWCDIGYHFLVSYDGQLWEGRTVENLGTHVGGNNTGNIGISFIGCFHPTADCASFQPNEPSEAMIEAGAGLVAGLGSIFGITPNGTTVLGHRDHTGASTACPGDLLHARLDDLRDGAALPAPYAAEYVMQTFPLASQPFELAPMQEQAGYLEMRNIGSATWRPGETFLGTTEPRDGASAIQAADWVSSTRAATIDRVVAPGETGRFAFSVRAPDAPGDYPQFFNLVQDGVAWFGDPDQGGPPDDVIQIRVTTLDVAPWRPDAGPLPMTDASLPEIDAGTPAVDGGPGRMDVDDGCGCRAAGRPSRGAPLASLALLGLLALRRRRA